MLDDEKTLENIDLNSLLLCLYELISWASASLICGVVPSLSCAVNQEMRLIEVMLPILKALLNQPRYSGTALFQAATCHLQSKFAQLQKHFQPCSPEALVFWLVLTVNFHLWMCLFIFYSISFVLSFFDLPQNDQRWWEDSNWNDRRRII